MRVAFGVDHRVGFSVPELRDLAPVARRLGFDSLWTPSGGGGAYDPLALCAAWNEAGGLPTGIAVMPVTQMAPEALAKGASRVPGRFVLGIGSGAIAERPVSAVRHYVGAVRRGADVRVYVAALGPRMLRLAGQIADGVALNWCTPEHVAWSREQVGRDIPVVSYIRMCVDDDVAAARRALGAQIFGYALGRLGARRDRGYRAHFARMGFERELEALESRRDAGATPDELAAEVPARLLEAVGYAGPAAGARAALARLGAGLDLAIVRAVVARPGAASVRALMDATAPAP